jgi:hypothetical protein
MLFERVKPLPSVTLTRAGTPAMQLSIALGIGFKPAGPDHNGAADWSFNLLAALNLAAGLYAAPPAAN